jgi:glutaredoxin
MKCPKCGHARTMGETAPGWQCPSCGVAYAKAADPRVAPSGRTMKSDRDGRFTRFVVLLLAIGAGLAFVAITREDPARTARVDGLQPYQQARVIMYSLTTCGYCVQKRAQLLAAGIQFEEHFIDADSARMQELSVKLTNAGYRGGAIGTPTFEVNGKMLPNNPSLDTIRKHL